MANGKIDFQTAASLSFRFVFFAAFFVQYKHDRSFLLCGRFLGNTAYLFMLPPMQFLLFLYLPIAKPVKQLIEN